jgi:hypothetical protein
MATGAHPILPFDIVEANYLLPLPDSLLSTTKLVTHHMFALQKQPNDLAKLWVRVHTHHNEAAL